MRKLIEFQILDINAQHYGLDLFKLMENAGIQLAKHISKNTKHTTPIKFICGHGNNGGDGFMAARILKDKGFDVEVYLVQEPKTPPSKKAMKLYNGNIQKIRNIKDIKDQTTVIIDCLLGSGIVGIPRSPYKEIIGEINQLENISYFLYISII